MKIQATLLSIAGFLMLLFISNGAMAQKWVKVNTDNGNLQAQFPEKPNVESEGKENLKTYKLTVESGPAYYLVGVTIHETPLDMVDPEELAEESLKAFVNETKGTVLSSEPWKYKKSTGREAVIQLKATDMDPNAEEAADMTLNYRVLIMGQRQYQMVYAGPSDQLSEKNKKKFYKSFKAKVPK